MKHIRTVPYLALLLAAVPASAHSNVEFFEAKIRPVLARNCYGCHSSKPKSPMGGLALDSKAGLRKGESSGALVIPGKPADRLLAKALTYTDPGLV